MLCHIYIIKNQNQNKQTIKNKQTNKQTNKHVRFLSTIIVDLWSSIILHVSASQRKQYAEDLLQEFVELFKDFLNIRNELLLVDGRFSRTRDIQLVKKVIKELADPMRVSQIQNTVIIEQKSW